MPIHFRNFLLYGDGGSGKTTLAATIPGARKVLFDSFDPGGYESILNFESVLDVFEWSGAPSIAARTRGIDAAKLDLDPVGQDAAVTYTEWTKEWARREKNKVFAEYDAYVLDSASTLHDLVLRRVIALDGRAGKTPDRSDYIPVTDIMGNIAARACNKTIVPCHFVLIAHEEAQKCDITGRVMVRPLFPGRLQAKISDLFGEVYHCSADTGPKGHTYTVQTAPGGLYMKAKTRMGAGGKLAFKEDVTVDWKKPFREQGIARLASKCGVEL